MSYHPNHPHNGPAGGGPPHQNVAVDFNAMLQRSLQEQQPPPPARDEAGIDVPGSQAPTMGYGGVYQSTPPPNAEFAPPGVLGGARPPPPQQQPILPFDLPPQAFLTSSMLLDMVDKKVDVLLRDEKEYIGILRSYDQFANLVLTECYERISARNPEAHSEDPTIPKWVISDVKLPGILTIRGENVTICATVDLDREDNPKNVKFINEDDVRALAASQKAKKRAADEKKAKAFKAVGIEPGFGMQA